MRAAALSLTLLLALPAAAQDDGVTHAAEALRERVTGIEGLPDGPIAIRPIPALPEDAPSPHALIARLLAPSAEALGAHVTVFGGEAEQGATTARRLGYRALLDVTVGLEPTALVIDVQPWSTEPRTALPARRVRAPLDPSVRAHVGWPPVLTDHAVRVRHGAVRGEGYAALAIHDLDGDGRGELIAVGADGVRVLRVERLRRTMLRVRPIATVPWPDDLPLAASRRRRLVATAVATDDGVRIRTSDHARAVTLRRAPTGQPVLATEALPCDGFPLDAGCASLVNGRDFFDETLTGEPGLVATAHFYAHVADTLADRDGASARFEALVSAHGRLAIRVTPLADGAEAVTNGAMGYGSALAMADLDLDGSAELLVTHASAPGGPDQLSLVRATPTGGLDVVWRGEPTEGPVWASAAGDLDGDGLPELVAIEAPAEGARRRHSRLWMIR